jgi:hypothetical protein
MLIDQNNWESLEGKRFTSWAVKLFPAPVLRKSDGQRRYRTASPSLPVSCPMVEYSNWYIRKYKRP